jgi:putative colanic acid biosynthesis UDP-glucose lipid carrier transferase
MTFEFVMTEPTPTYRVLKRAVDVAVAIIGFAVMALPMLVIVLALLVSGTPVLFRQTRIGEGGRPFTMYKFRTMNKEADPYAPKPLETATHVTRVGRVLRASGLDELPQLWNVLRGDMSLVGPRPEMPFIVERYDPAYRLRLQARPGLTGLWQISTVRNQPINHGIEYDLFYLAHRRLVLDVWILYRTPLLLLFGRHVRMDQQLIDRWGRPALGLQPPTVVLDISDSTAPRLDLDLDLATERVQSS